MQIEELKEHFEEMIRDLESLISSGKLNSDDIEGFIMCLRIGDEIGANISLSILEQTINERCNLLSMIGYKLDISVEQFFEFHKKVQLSQQSILTKILGWFKR